MEISLKFNKNIANPVENFLPPDLSRDYIYSIWKKILAKEKLKGDELILSELLISHPEYYAVWDSANRLKKRRFDRDDPFFHLAVDFTVYKHIVSGTPHQIKLVVERLLKRGVSEYDVLHAVGAAFLDEFAESVNEERAFNPERYVDLTQRLDWDGEGRDDEPNTMVYKGIEVDLKSGSIVGYDLDEVSRIIMNEKRTNYDDKRISPVSAHLTLLKRYPSIWINGIVKFLALNPIANRKQDKARQIVDYLVKKKNIKKILKKIPSDAVFALKEIIENKGFVEYNTFTKRFGDEHHDSIFWSETPPSSVLGKLRLSGLVVIGKIEHKQKQVKAVIVPEELRDIITDLI